MKSSTANASSVTQGKQGLICPDCRHPLSLSKQCYTCGQCESDFSILEDEIIDFLPRWNRVGDEIIYRLLEYKSQFDHLQEIRRYFYSRRLARWAMSWGHKNIIRFVSKKVDGVSVDLGVGNGDHYDYVENPDALMGVDYDITALREIRKKGVHAKLFRADLCRLPFPDSYFDTIRSTYTFEHLYYLEVCLEEIYRTLKHDGTVVASFPIVGGWLMDSLSRLGPQREFKKKYGLDWRRVLEVEHCNSSRRILEAVERIFKIEEMVWSPFTVPSHNLNMFVTLKARQNLAFA